MQDRSLDVTDLCHKVVELLPGVGVFLGHLFVLGLPLVTRSFESLHFALEVAGLDVGLAEPVRNQGLAMQSHEPTSCLSP